MGAISDERLHAAGNLDTEGFADLLSGLLKAAWGENWGTFTDENPTGTTPEQLPMPIISWDVRKRVPCEALKQPKYRNWGTEPDPDNPGEFLAIFRQWFDSEIEFKVWAKTSREAKQLVRRLEEILTVFAGYFKERGISDLTFVSERSADISSAGLQEMACRILTYKVRTEHIIVARSAALNEVITRAEMEQA